MKNPAASGRGIETDLLVRLCPILQSQDYALKGRGIYPYSIKFLSKNNSAEPYESMDKLQNHL